MTWWNNGIINKKARECPEGFVKGKLRKMHNNDKKFIDYA